MPSLFHPLRRTVLGTPDQHFLFSRANLKDIAINVIGFIPLGFILTALLGYSMDRNSPSVYGATLFLGFCLSLGIELAQAYFPMRDSSILDVIGNSIGTATGIFITKYAFHVIRRM
jgi:glycopeptide antibiotics resistance protein